MELFDTMCDRGHEQVVFFMDHISQETDRLTGVHEVDGGSGDAVPMQSIYDLDMDVFVPCALGGVINEDTVPRLKCAIVAGSANDQLESEAWGTALEERGNLCAPDYPINAGGLINVAIELQGYDNERAHRQVSLIYNNLEKTFDIAERDAIPGWQAADRMAEERIAAVGRTKLPCTRRFKDRLSGRAHHTTTTH